MSDQERLRMLQDISDKVSKLYATMYGVEGQDGLLRELHELRGDIEGLKGFRWKTIGAASAVGALGGKLASLF